MSLNPFQPQGNTVCITVTGASSTAVQVPSAQGAGLGGSNYLATVVGTVTVFLNWAQASAGTAGAAVIPTAGSPANGMPLLAASAQSITLPPGAWVTTIASGAGSTLYLTPGDGI
jgi:hypothetical protein